MNLQSIKTVWARELRDQLRDRRTLFMVLVLPLLMYPIMGVSFFRLIQFNREHKATVLLVGRDQAPSTAEWPALLDGPRFAARLSPRVSVEKLQIEYAPDAATPDYLAEQRGRLSSGGLDAIIIFPDDFADRLAEMRRQIDAIASGGADPAARVPEPPRPVVLYNSTSRGSELAFLKVERLLDAWRKQIVGQNLEGKPALTGALRPFRVESQDVAEPAARRAGMWAKFLPFMAFLWALTGAFYPAVDVCAGEKERGTLETLLVSPASRAEIVWGKLLTVFVFSMATALLNLAGIAAAGSFVADQLGSAGLAGLGRPPLAPLLWLLAALPPVSAIFSALAFACASFARSTKEGQYYFMPLFLATLPLMLMPLMPGVELNLGTSLAPIMGLALLVSTLLSGDFWEAARYAAPVTAVTFGCCLLAARWAVAQFEQESVLFRGDERFDPKLWLRGVLRRSRPTPTPAMAVACVALVLLLQFATRGVLTRLAPPAGEFTFWSLAGMTLASQACVLLPAILFGFWLTSNPRETFLLQPPPQAPRAKLLLLGGLLAVAVHPLGLQLSEWIKRLYPLSDSLVDQTSGMSQVLAGAPSALLAVGLIGLLPGVVEELTFRGVVLGGLRTWGSRGTKRAQNGSDDPGDGPSDGPGGGPGESSAVWAVIGSAVAFGAVHPIFQQSVSAAILGLLLGALAVTTRSLWPCIGFHVTYNSLLALLAYYAKPLESWLASSPAAARLVRSEAGAVLGYRPVVVLAASAAAILLFWAIRRSTRITRQPASRRIGGHGGPASVGVPVSEASEG
ncbi:MAG: ABC transporter permease subunit [Planctomycetota bacterium]